MAYAPPTHTHNTRAYNSILLERPLTIGEMRHARQRVVARSQVGWSKGGQLPSNGKKGLVITSTSARPNYYVVIASNSAVREHTTGRG